MQIEKVNGFWVPSNDVHIEDWKKDKHFTQNKCLEKLIAYCKDKNIKFNHILDIGAWVGTWTMTMNNFSEKIIAFEPDPLFLLTDHIPMPRNFKKSLLKSGISTVSVGPTVLHSSQCIAVVLNELDRKSSH